VIFGFRLFGRFASNGDFLVVINMKIIKNW